jgi:hypothetical protein
MADEPKGQDALRWFGDEAQAQRLREEKTHHYVRLTFFASVAVLIVGPYRRRLDPIALK